MTFLENIIISVKILENPGLVKLTYCIMDE